MFRLTRLTVTLSAALGLVLAGSATASAYPGQNAERGVFHASSHTKTKVADVLGVDARCIQVRQSKAYAVWAWVGPTYRMGCDHQLDDATIMVKGDRAWGEAGISGDNVYSCTLLKRNMLLYVEDSSSKVQRLTQEAFRDFKVAGYCE